MESDVTPDGAPKIAPHHQRAGSRRAIRQLRVGHQEIGSSATGGQASGALAAGAGALGAVAVGALALGPLTISRLGVGPRLIRRPPRQRPEVEERKGAG